MICMATLSTHITPPTAISVPDVPAIPDCPPAALFAYIGVDEPFSNPRPVHQFVTNPAVWAPDQAAQILARTGATSATFRAAWHAVLHRVRHNPAALESLADQLDNSELWFADDVDGVPAPPATGEVDHTSKLYRIAVLLCAILTARARTSMYSRAWRSSALVVLIAATVAELWALDHAEDQHAETDPARDDWPEQPPPPILEALTTCVLTAAPPALDTTGVECPAALPLTAD